MSVPSNKVRVVIVLTKNVVNNQRKNLFVAIYDGKFYIELIIVIGSSSITLSGKFKKVRKRKAIYSKTYLVALY